jgi:Ni/Fe-hydrogenase subunit HybB-like protein
MKLALRIVLATGLLVDAYIHVHLAGQYDAVKTSVLSQGDLFRVEAVAALLTSIAVLAVRGRYATLAAPAAVAVAAGGVAAVLVYRYVDIGALGPLPPMYEPVWYAEKSLSLVAELLAAMAALALLAARRRMRAEVPTSDDRARSAT